MIYNKSNKIQENKKGMYYMTLLQDASWICAPSDYGSVCPIFSRKINIHKKIRIATLSITALGCYTAQINGKRIGKFVLAPGWTSYDKRLQVQEYDVSHLLTSENTLEITAGMGWYHSGMAWTYLRPYKGDRIAVICALHIIYEDGTEEVIHSNEQFLSAKTQILQSTIYGGEIYDARPYQPEWESAAVVDFPKTSLIPQEGEDIIEVQSIKPISVNRCRTEDYVVDFGQNLTGYVEFTSQAPAGTIIEIRHGEILDENGILYTENLRSAQQRIFLISNGESITYKPHFTFQGFRYIQVVGWQGELNPEDFTAIVVHSDMVRTGNFTCSHPKLNKLFENIVWGQRGNFLDIPTDCPQRDERLGWTGDAQMFIKTATYNYDVERFFIKWLRDLKAEQFEDGGIPAVIPDLLGREPSSSSAWGDAAVICPWQIYLSYGNRNILEDHYESMTKWIYYIKNQGDNPCIWNTGHHFGDWLGLDAKPGSYMGSTDQSLIATAYFAYSTSIVIRVGRILGRDVGEFETLYEKVRKAYQENFIKDDALICQTQTAHALTIFFDLVDDIEPFGNRLAQLVKDNGNKLSTGFVGTPYLLPALSKTGHHELAYTLLLQEEFPSWLYSVNQGATTIWEHWDGINDKGELWSANMNSFNHYAYGAVADWMYEVMAGIRIDEANPGFEHIIFAPITDKRLDHVSASVDTRNGLVSASWERKGTGITYTFVVPQGSSADIIIGDSIQCVSSGTYVIKK